MMASAAEQKFDVERLFLAIEALQREGYSLWLLEDGLAEATKNLDVLQLVFESFPEDLPILNGELELLAQVFREIMAQGHSAN